MQFNLISFTVWIIFIISFVTARSLNPIESNMKTNLQERQSYVQYPSKEDSKLLPYIKRHRTKPGVTKDLDLLSSDNIDDVYTLPKRGFFLFPGRRSSQRYRPIHFYGRKSHWDTFFG